MEASYKLQAASIAYKRVMPVSRKFARQGKASAKPDGIVTYVEGDKSKL